MFILWRSPATRPLLPAAMDPVGCCRDLFCAPERPCPKSIGCSGSCGEWRAQGSSLRAWPCGGSNKSGILLSGSLFPHHQPGSSHQSKFVGSNTYILVVLSNWPLYEPLYPWHLKLVAFSLSPQMSLGWTLPAEHFFELKATFRGPFLRSPVVSELCESLQTGSVSALLAGEKSTSASGPPEASQHWSVV